MRYSLLLRWLFPFVFIALVLIFSMIYVTHQREKEQFDELSNTPNVQYVLPNSFRGLFVLRFPENDQEIANAQEFILTDENRYSLTIPPSGIAIVKDMNVLLDFHSLSATYQDGRKLGVKDFDNVKDTDVALRPSRQMADGSNWNLVGTQLEMEWLYGHGELFIPGQGPIATGTIHQVVFIVPDDHTGFFRIIETRDENTDESLIEHENDVWKISVPLSGIIRTSQAVPFRADYRISMQYTSGRIPSVQTAYISIASVTEQTFPQDRSEPRIWGFHVGRLLRISANTTPGLSLPEDK